MTLRDEKRSERERERERGGAKEKELVDRLDPAAIRNNGTGNPPRSSAVGLPIAIPAIREERAMISARKPETRARERRRLIVTCYERLPEFACRSRRLVTCRSRPPRKRIGRSFPSTFPIRSIILSRFRCSRECTPIPTTRPNLAFIYSILFLVLPISLLLHMHVLHRACILGTRQQLGRRCSTLSRCTRIMHRSSRICSLLSHFSLNRKKKKKKKEKEKERRARTSLWL